MLGSPAQLAAYLRKRPYQVNLLLGGYDAVDGASLYFIDYMGTKQKTDYAAHGYCSNFILSVMDRHYKVRCPHARVPVFTRCHGLHG